MNNNNIHHFRP